MTASAAFDAYNEYVGLKAHFGGYIEWRPGLVMKQAESVEAFVKRSDFKAFMSLVDTWGTEAPLLRSVLITVFTESPRAWVGEAVTPEMKSLHLKRMARLRALETEFLYDLHAMNDWCVAKKIVFRDFITVGNPPGIIKPGPKRKACLETLALIHAATGFASVKTADPWWERKRQVIPFYTPFLAPYIDLAEAGQLIKAVMAEVT